MPSLRSSIEQETIAVFKDSGLKPELAKVRRSDRPDLADFQCNGALPAAKAAGTNPRELAGRLMEALSARLSGIDVSVAGPGFLNFKVGDAGLGAVLAEMSADPDRLNADKVSDPRLVVIDYGGPNIAKPMHVGHLRASIIGETIKRLVRFVGHSAIGDIHLGDWGRQMGMVIFGIEERFPDLVYFDPKVDGPYPEEAPVSLQDLEEIYPKISARAEEDQTVLGEVRRITFELQQGRAGYRALWGHIARLSIDEIQADLARLGVTFDQWFGESRYQDRLPGLIDDCQEKGIVEEDAGALIIRVAKDSDKKELPPVILRSSEGAALYHTTDLATIEERVNTFGAQQLLYVVDNRQALHFEQLFRAAQRAGFAAPGGMEHLGFGTMNGADGKPFKTRAGGTVKLKDLISSLIDQASDRLKESDRVSAMAPDDARKVAEQVGVATLKFADLSHDRKSNYIFDIDKFSRFEGKTGPYLQYSAVRIQSILEKASEQGLAPGPVLALEKPEARALAALLVRFSDEVMGAFEARAPHLLADYVFDVAQSFSQFYHAAHILNEKQKETQASHLSLARVTLLVLERSLDLLGIEVPSRM